MMKRIFIFVCLILLVMWIHPILAIVVAGGIGFVTYPHYYEIIGIGVISDVVYQTLIPVLFLNAPLYTLITLILFILMHIVSKRMNMYA